VRTNYKSEASDNRLHRRELACALLAVFVLLGATACGGRGRETAATVTVTVPASTNTETGSAPQPPQESNTAQVVVRGQGFSQEGESLSYGVVLRNVSPVEDALDVSVTTNFVDASGTILKTESETMNVIPASTTYYLGGNTYPESGSRVARLETDVTVGDRASASYSLPKVSHVRLVNEEYIGLSVHGQVENTLDSPLSDFARISAVVFDSRGRVVGGGFTYLDAPLAPGRRAAFDASIDAAPSTTTRARVSVENSIVSGG
jgi:hypothetical protein